MARFLHRFFVWFGRNVPTVLLVACFFAGFIPGIRMSCKAAFSFSLMRGAMDSAVSIVSALCVLLLPLFFSALAVYFSKPKLLYGIAFLKAFTFAFVSAGITSGFGSAGWLARRLLMFSDSLSLPLLWLYWLRHIPGKGVFQPADTILIASCMGFIGFADHVLISPLLQGI